MAARESPPRGEIEGSMFDAGAGFVEEPRVVLRVGRRTTSAAHPRQRGDGMVERTVVSFPPVMLMSPRSSTSMLSRDSLDGSAPGWPITGRTPAQVATTSLAPRASAGK